MKLVQIFSWFPYRDRVLKPGEYYVTVEDVIVLYNPDGTMIIVEELKEVENGRGAKKKRTD